MTVDGGPDAAELTDNDKAQNRLSPLLMLISGFRLWVILAPLNSPTKSPFGGKSCNKKRDRQLGVAVLGSGSAMQSTFK